MDEALELVEGRRPDRKLGIDLLDMERTKKTVLGASCAEKPTLMDKMLGKIPEPKGMVVIDAAGKLRKAPKKKKS
jgi:ABC-type uncharacterized transport system ATPase subunit